LKCSFEVGGEHSEGRANVGAYSRRSILGRLFRLSRSIAEAISRFPSDSDFAGILDNLVRAGADMKSLLRLYYQHKTDPAWARDSTAAAMQRIGNDFFATKSYKDALLAFEINVRDYPASLSEALRAVQTIECLRTGGCGVEKCRRDARTPRHEIELARGERPEHRSPTASVASDSDQSRWMPVRRIMTRQFSLSSGPVRVEIAISFFVGVVKALRSWRFWFIFFHCSERARVKSGRFG
jgi:hypothetical protein